MKGEAGIEVEQGSTAFSYNGNHTLNLGRGAYREILIFIWREATEGEILMLIVGGLHERHAVQRGIGVPTQHLF
jgi:hypothetical protein